MNNVMCHRLFTPKFSKVKLNFFVEIREVSDTLTPNVGVCMVKHVATRRISSLSRGGLKCHLVGLRSGCREKDSMEQYPIFKINIIERGEPLTFLIGKVLVQNHLAIFLFNIT